MFSAVLLGRPSPQRALLEGLFKSCLGCSLTVLEDTAQLTTCLSKARPDILLLGAPDGSILWLDIVSLFHQHPSYRPPVVLTYSAGLCARPHSFGDAALRCISQPNELWEHCLMELLLALGFSGNTPGRQYLACAIRLAAQNPEELSMLTKSLYGRVARLVHSTPTAAEKAMRKEVHDAFQCRNAAAWERLFPTNCAQKRCPALGEFLRTMYEALYFGEAAAWEDNL